MKTIIAFIISTFCFFSTYGQQWNWLEVEHLSVARTSLTATTLDDSLFFSGGGLSWGSSFTNTVDIYDVGDDIWSSTSLESTPRWGATSVTAGGKVFMAGGNTYPASGGNTDVDIYTKETNSWSVEHLSLGRMVYGGVAVCENKVFFAGGFYLINNATLVAYTDVIDIYDLETELWSVDYLSEQKGLIGTAVVGTKIYFAGGATGEEQATTKIDIYDVSSGIWSAIYLSEPRAAVAAVSYDNDIYFAGGTRPNGTSCTVIDVYDTEQGTWKDTIYLSSPRIIRAMRVNDGLVFAGLCNTITLVGALYISSPNGLIDVYYPNTGQWDYGITTLIPARVFYADVVFEDKAYFAGGSNSAGGDPIDYINILEYKSDCLPDGIEFSSQAEVDDFYGDHPGCYDIEGDVIINGEDIENLNGLDLIASIGGNFSIMSNDILTSLTGLENLTSIGGNLEIIGNPGLTVLTGLGNIDPASIENLSIYGNPLLSHCDVWSICQYLGTPGGIIDIHTNAEGCNNMAEVEEACLTDVSEIAFDNQFKITPNLIKSTATIEFSLHQSSYVSLAVYNLSRQEIIVLVNEYQQQGKQQITFNTGDLSAGIYFCVLKTNNGILTKKIVKL